MDVERTREARDIEPPAEQETASRDVTVDADVLRVFVDSARPWNTDRRIIGSLLVGAAGSIIRPWLDAASDALSMGQLPRRRYSSPLLGAVERVSNLATARGLDRHIAPPVQLVPTQRGARPRLVDSVKRRLGSIARDRE
jgi:hypothetical protein